MPSEIRMVKNSPLKSKPYAATKPTKPSGAATASEENSSHLPNALNLTQRFTNEEKKILYNLFRQHENVIDIKSRQKQKGKHSIRNAWQSIVDGFNGHPNVGIHRNIKQIQKFWLNARLRKQYPSKATKDRKPRATISLTTKEDALPPTIKCESKYSLPARDSSATTENTHEYEEVELQEISLSDPITIKHLEESTEAIPTEYDIIEETKFQPRKDQNTHNQSQHQLNVDHISTEKLSLTDLLQFKNARPEEEVIFEIKQSDGRFITQPSANCITVPQRQGIYNQVIGEIKCQPHIQVQHYQAPPKTTQIQQQYNATNSTNYTYTIQQNQPHATIVSNIGKPTVPETGNSTVLVVPNSFEEKINYFKLKATELREKEAELLSEQKRIELSELQEELRHKKEMHRLQVEEMQIKIRILCEEERQLTIIKES